VGTRSSSHTTSFFFFWKM